MYSVYKLDLDSDYESNPILEDLCEKWYDKIITMYNDFTINRALIYKYTSSEIRAEVIENFDLYITHLFIYEYYKIKNEYDSLVCKNK